MRRIGSTPAERGCGTNNSCPDVFETDGGDFLVIGKVIDGGGIGAASFAAVAGASMAPNERAVIVPRDCMLAAAKQLTAEG